MHKQLKTLSFDKDAFDAAEKWFEIHAKQRMELFRFYAAILTAMVAITGLLLREEMWGIALVVSLVSIGICLVFRALDKRTSQLVKVGEQAMEIELDRIKHKNKFINFIEQSEPKADGAISYSKAIGILSLLFVIFFASSAGVSFFECFQNEN